MDDYVVKPVNLALLRQALEACRPLGPRPDTAEASPAASTSHEALDRSVLRELQEQLGDAESVRKVIATFLRSTPGLLTALHDAAVKGDADGLRRAAHTIKSSSAMLGARALSAGCEELERLSRAGDVADAPARVAALEARYVEVERGLEADTASG